MKKPQLIFFWCFLLLLLCSVAVLNCYSQTNDSVQHSATPGGPHLQQSASEIDSAQLKPHKFQPNPKKAGLYSAIVPGLGQFYNRQYWKVPVIYAGLAVAGYFFIDNLNNYQSFRLAYIGRINNPYPTDKYVKTYTTDQLNQLQNDYSKYLNLTVLFTGIGYGLQVVEAITAAHLKNFDISRDLSIKVRPVIFPNAAGLGIVANFR